MLRLIEATCADWLENYRVEDIRLDDAKIDYLMDAKGLIDCSESVDDADVRLQAPSYVQLVSEVFMRDYKEIPTYGPSLSSGDQRASCRAA